MNQQDAESAFKAILMLRSDMAQREARMSASLNQQIQSLQQQLGQFRREVTSIVEGASTQIAMEAKSAVAPVTAEYERAVSATSAHLQGASKTIWLWLGTSVALLLLVLFVGWSVLAYYRRELSTARQELGRYENAIPIIQAFNASDAVICNGHICANIDPNGLRAGDKRQYRQVKPRPQ